MMGPTTVAVMAALLAGGSPASAAHSAPPAATAITHDAAIRGHVRGLEIAPAPNGTAIVLDVDAAVALNHFTLDNPSRLVVDLGGASLSIRSNYDGKAHGLAVRALADRPRRSRRPRRRHRTPRVARRRARGHRSEGRDSGGTGQGGTGQKRAGHSRGQA
jgi:hypothetical protein